MTQRNVLLIDSGHQAFDPLVAADVPDLSGSYDASGAAAAAQAAAISTAASDATTKANAAQSTAEGYTDSSIAALVILSQAQVLTRGLGS